MTHAPVSAAWRALGTSAAVSVTEPAALPRARAAVEAELAAIDRACSRFHPDSELSRLNAAGGRPTAVGPLLRDAIAAALRAAELTGGIVDPTIGAALILAGYDDDFDRLTQRSGPLRAIRVPGWRTVALDAAAGTVTLGRGVSLDLGATAKALAADRAARAAAAATGDPVGVLVNLGGDLAVAGTAPAGGWTVGVADDHRDAPSATVAIRSGGVATSSTTVRRWGPGRHHLIDPRTGVPATGPWRTVTVAAASCLDANIASTAAIVLGHEAADWLTARGLPARLVGHDGAVRAIGAWPREAVAA